MNLIDYLVDITAGLAGGFIIGRSGFTEKSLDKLQIIEQVNSVPELKASHREIDDKYRGLVNNITTACRFTYPFIFASYMAYVPSLFSSKSFSENMPVNALSSLAGCTLGIAHRKFSRRKDKDILRDIQQNPEIVLNYLSEENKNTLEKSLSRIESDILKDIEPKELFELDSDYGKLIISIQNDSRIYSPALAGNLLRRLKSTIDEAFIQKSYKEFLQMAPVETISILEMGSQPNHENIRLFENDGESLKVYTVKFGPINSIYDEKRDQIQISGVSPQITLDYTRNWNDDYKDLAKEVISSRGESSIMYLKSYPGMPEERRIFLVKRTFILDYAESQRKKYS